MKREERNPARALRQDDAARLDPADHDDGVPRRERCARQRRGLDGVKVARHLHDAVLVQEHEFLKHAVARAAQHAGPVILAERAVDPGLCEAGAHAVADSDARHPGTCGNHGSGPVRHRNERQLAASPPVAPARHDEVPIVHRGRLDSDDHLSGAGNRFGSFAWPQIFEAPCISDLHHAHGTDPRLDPATKFTCAA